MPPQKPGQDHYEVLGIGADTPQPLIRPAWLASSKKHHPDRNPGNGEAAARFNAVMIAWEVLRDPGLRAAYDESRSRARAGAVPRRTTAPGKAHRRGPGITLTLEQAFLGGSASVNFPSASLCGRCRGSGSVEGMVTACMSCAGMGVVPGIGASAGWLACGRCRGLGRLAPVSACAACDGDGVSPGSGLHGTVSFPPGVGDGALLAAEVSPGLVFDIPVTVSAHKVFRREGDNVSVRRQVTATMLGAGAALTVQAVDGSRVRLKIPAGTRTGTRLRVRGKGWWTAGGRRGDLMVDVKTGA